MRRRDFLGLVGGAAAWPVVGQAQTPKMRVIGFLGMATPEAVEAGLKAFRQALTQHGYEESHNVSVDYRWAGGDYARLPSLAADLVRDNVDIIVTSPAVEAVLAAKAATSKIPIVFDIGADPVAVGLIPSLSRPGGLITGVTSMTGETAPKGLGLLLELVPSEHRIAVLTNPDNHPSVAVMTDPDGSFQTAVRARGLQPIVFDARTENEIESALQLISQQAIRLLSVGPDPFFTSQSGRLAELTNRYKVAAYMSSKDFPSHGGLMGYGADRAEVYRLAGEYAARVLNGDKPGDLPVLQSTKFEFVINLKTAKALGLEVPANLLALADEVIE